MAAVRPFRGVYYGWVIVGGLALISVASGAMGNLTVALFIQPMTDDLGISKLEFGLAQSARLLGFGASGWFLGRILDRHGARIPLAIAGALGGLVAVGLADRYAFEIHAAPGRPVTSVESRAPVAGSRPLVRLSSGASPGKAPTTSPKTALGTARTTRSASAICASSIAAAVMPRRSACGT